MTANSTPDPQATDPFTPEEEDKAWRAAYHIAWVGGSNPVGISHQINDVFIPHLGADHPAVQAMQAHLDFLTKDSLGPSPELLDQVVANAKRLGLYSERD